MSRKADYYKRRLLRHFQAWGNDYVGAVYEAPNLCSADVVACKYNGRLSEFEIKVSKADLLGEVAAIKRALEPESVTTTTQNTFGFEMGFEIVKVAETKCSKTKVRKHHHYLVSPRKHFRPNQFYFAVPMELVSIAVEATKGLKYGVMDADALTIAKKAQSLHQEIHPNATYINLCNRMSVMYREKISSQDVLVRRVLEDVAEHYELDRNSVGWLRLMEVEKKWKEEYA